MIGVVIFSMCFITSCSQKTEPWEFHVKRAAITDEAIAANKKVFEENMPIDYGEFKIELLIKSLLAALDIEKIEEVVVFINDKTGYYQLSIVDEFGETYYVSLDMFGYLSIIRKGDVYGETIFVNGF